MCARRQQTTKSTHNTTFTMPSLSNTLLIEGTIEELSDELANYIDDLRQKQNVEGSIQPEVNSLLQEKKVEDALKKLVGAASILNSAPEKGGSFLYGLCGPPANWHQKSSRPTICSSISFDKPPTQTCSYREYVHTSPSQYHPLPTMALVSRLPFSALSSTLLHQTMRPASTFS